MSYIYKHIRLDTNEIFYIGIGSDLNFQRSRDKTDRTDFWKAIVNKSKYNIEIITNNITWEEACIKESELINLYGRRDLNQGTLVNMTNGGEGAYGRCISNQTKQKISITVKKNTHWKNGLKHTPEAINKIINAGNKKVIDIVNNIIYKSIEDAAISINIRPNTLSRKLSGIRTNNTNFKYYNNAGI